MARPLTLLLACCLIPFAAQAQNIGINATGATPNASAMLDISANDRGLLIPRMTAAQRAAITSPATGLLVFQTNASAPVPANQFWYYDGSVWRPLFNDRTGWSTTGNLGTTAGTNYIGTNDAVDFVVKTGGVAAANERMRVLSGGQVVVNRAIADPDDAFSAYALGRGNLTNTGTTAISGYANSGVGAYGESDHALGIGVWGANSVASGNSTGVLGTVSANTGTGVLGVATLATGVNTGVFGQSGSTTGTGTVGFATATSGQADGVFGQSNSPAGNAVFGSNTAATGSAVALRGQSTSNQGTAILGIANTSNTQIPNNQGAIGVQGQVNGRLATNGQAIGLLGITHSTMTTGDANGVWGQTGSADGTGVVGIASGRNGVGVYADAGYTGSGMPTGVLGFTQNANGASIWGVNLNAYGTGLIGAGNNQTTASTAPNGSGGAFTGTFIGGYGVATRAADGVGLSGVGNNLGSVITPARGAGVVGYGQRYGVMGFTSTTVNTNPNNSQAANGNNAAAGGYFEVNNGGTVQTYAYVGVRDNTNTLRKIIGPGTMNTIVRDLEDNLVALSAPEAPENLFQDYGSGTLQGGKAHVELDPILTKNIVVNESHPLRVFVQLEGDCNGVYVTNKTESGFDVVELGAGTSNTPFTWTVVANRADEVLPDGTVSRYSAERFAPAPAPAEKVVSKSREMKQPVRMKELAPSAEGEVQEPKPIERKDIGKRVNGQ